MTIRERLGTYCWVALGVAIWIGADVMNRLLGESERERLRRRLGLR